MITNGKLCFSLMFNKHWAATSKHDSMHRNSKWLAKKRVTDLCRYRLSKSAENLHSQQRYIKMFKNKTSRRLDALSSAFGAHWECQQRMSAAVSHAVDTLQGLRVTASYQHCQQYLHQRLITQIHTWDMQRQLTSVVSNLYTESKKTGPLLLFTVTSKCWSIFKILLLSESEGYSW